MLASSFLLEFAYRGKPRDLKRQGICLFTTFHLYPIYLGVIVISVWALGGTCHRQNPRINIVVADRDTNLGRLTIPLCFNAPSPTYLVGTLIHKVIACSLETLPHPPAPLLQRLGILATCYRACFDFPCLQSTIAHI